MGDIMPTSTSTPLLIVQYELQEKYTIIPERILYGSPVPFNYCKDSDSTNAISYNNETPY